MTGVPVKDGFRSRFSVSGLALLVLGGVAQADSEPPHPAALDAAIITQARRHGVPEKLVRRIVMRESKYNAHAHNRAYWGLMQISYPTAKSMGFKGKPRELLDPFVNLTYAVPYLANAFIIAGKQEDAAVRLYASGYYQTAKSRGVLDELRTADSEPVNPQPTLLTAAAQPIANLATAVYNTPAAVQAAAQSQYAPARGETAAAPPQDQQMASQQLAPSQSVSAAGPAGAGTRGGGSGHEPEIMMVALKDGLAPPKKWTRDGGTTVIAKGDQRIDKFAAYRLDGAPVAGPKAGTSKTTAPHGKPKLTVFARLDPSQPDQPPSLATQLMSNFQAYAPAPQEAGASQTAIAAVAANPEVPAPTLQLRGPVDSVATAESKPADGKSPQARAADVKAAAAKTGGRTVVAKAIPAKDAATKTAALAQAESAPSAAPASNPAPLETTTMPAIVAPPPPRSEAVKLTALALRGPEAAPVTGKSLVTRGLLMGAAAPLSASAFAPLAASPASEPEPAAKAAAPVSKAALKTASRHPAPSKTATARPLARTAAKPVQLHAAGG